MNFLCLKKMTPVLLLTALFVFFSGHLGTAYVLQGPHLLELMTAKLGKADTLLVNQKQIFFQFDLEENPCVEGGGGCEERNTSPVEEMVESSSDIMEETDTEPEVIEVEENARYIFSRGFRSETTSATSRRIHLATPSTTLTVIDDMIRPDVQSPFDLYKDLLVYRTRMELADHLVALGVDVSVSSLGRYEDRIAFVIGAVYPDNSAPQVWIDKDSFLPMRWVIAGGERGSSLDSFEIRYFDWRKVGPIWYPMYIEFIQDGIAARAIQAQKCTVNAMFAKDLFNVDRLRTDYRSRPQASDSARQDEEPSEIQKTIDEFRKIFD